MKDYQICNCRLKKYFFFKSYKVTILNCDSMRPTIDRVDFFLNIFQKLSGPQCDFRFSSNCTHHIIFNHARSCVMVWTHFFWYLFTHKMQNKLLIHFKFHSVIIHIGLPLLVPSPQFLNTYIFNNLRNKSVILFKVGISKYFN